MTELDYKHDVMGILKAMGWKVQAHEDMISNFIPDLSFGAHRIDGWIELKYVDKLPRSLGAIKHYTHGQQDWLIQRGTKGSGHCYLWVGTPSGHFVWQWSSLSQVRDLPWAEAAGQALFSEDITGLCRAISAVVKRRSSYIHSYPNGVQRANTTPERKQT